MEGSEASSLLSAMEGIVEGMDFKSPVSKASEATPQKPTVDLESYIAPYRGRDKVFRLKFIAKKYNPWARPALKMAMESLRGSPNVHLQRVIFDELKLACERDGVECQPLDDEALDRMATQSTREREKLDADLKNYKNNLMKEGIRATYQDLGAHFFDSGQLEYARKNLLKARDYCTSAKHTFDVHRLLIDIALETQNWDLLISYIAKTKASTELSKESQDAADLSTLLAVANLHKEDFRQVAHELINLPFNAFAENLKYMSTKDVGVIGGLCALATFDREELNSRVITNTSFKQFMELCPSMRDAIVAFHKSAYSTCIKLLNSIKDDLLLDMHLNPYVSFLFRTIEERALKQYVKPFVAVDMHRMSRAFEMELEDLEKRLADLIVAGDIEARIDSNAKVLKARQVNERASALLAVRNTANTYEKHVQALLVRAGMVRNNLRVVKDHKTSGDM